MIKSWDPADAWPAHINPIETKFLDEIYVNRVLVNHIVLDAAKNPQSLSSGCAERQLLDGGREISVVCGLVAHKPASRMPQTYRIMPSSSFPIWIYDVL